ncbi:biotin--[acetyl-CoA-carboxylase] ligase [Paenibacillus beijingensis]|uniref:Bifunctional ligase/repressor BirA n=1 Tax=Paenibacillus beijingensis TaxID=1126833 RepID=A0A0D5NPG1_9BACL|nr:biotin--[acetyl-CoA-carboxylase] ligase [Paenibacillus beijingensis]AJY77136.1 biotin [Paenibacillus beijingensis]
MNVEQMIRYFEQHDGGYVSGEALSQELNVSRTAVWKQIRKLEEKGYRFDASRRLGYRLRSKPDSLSAERIQERLTTVSFGRRIHLLGSVDSTQNVARQFAEEEAADGTLVIAEQQLSGRGRMGRQWVSPAGKGVWMSMVLRPRLPIHFAPQLTLLTAVALCRSLRTLTGLDIGIKWPNDLLIEGKKISGILLESAAEEERLRYVIAGIGISVNLEEDDYPQDLLPRATSLRIASGAAIDRTAVIASFLNEWEQLYQTYESSGFEPVRLLWEALSVSLHKPAVLITPQGKIEGVPVGLHDAGGLKVIESDGTERTVFSAEMGEPENRD